MANAAIVLVDGAVLCSSWGWRASSRATRKAASSRPSSSRAEFDDDEGKELGVLAHDLLNLVSRATKSIAIEAVCAAGGTFVMPGMGTMIMHIVGSLLAWI